MIDSFSFIRSSLTSTRSFVQSNTANQSVTQAASQLAIIYSITLLFTFILSVSRAYEIDRLNTRSVIHFQIFVYAFIDVFMSV
mgnify:CR=1 FL=1